MSNQQQATLHVSSGQLHDPYGNPVVLRGINLPLLDHWEFPGSDPLEEIIKTGANAIRIQWYIHYHDPSRGPYSVSDLGAFLDRCIAAEIVPIVMIGDSTDQDDMSLLSSTIVPWWTCAEVMAVLQPRAHYLILNLANELGLYRFAGDSGGALNTYIDTYKSAIAVMRAAGYKVPIMIDAPDYGTSLEVFIARGAELVAADPLGNILLSCHAYWAEYDGISQLNIAANKRLPLIFAEVANKQDDTENGGYYDLDGSGQNTPAGSGFTYQNFLGQLSNMDVGWLAWSWGPDNCDARQLSSDGNNFSSLTPYGEDIVNNTGYGLKSRATRIST